MGIRNFMPNCKLVKDKSSEGLLVLECLPEGDVHNKHWKAKTPIIIYQPAVGNSPPQRENDGGVPVEILDALMLRLKRRK